MILDLFKRRKKKRLPSEYACKWNEPWKGAPWEYQNCNSAMRRLSEHAEDLVDFSCSGSDCGYWEQKDDS